MPVEIFSNKFIISGRCVTNSIGLKHPCLVYTNLRIKFRFDVIQDIYVSFALFVHEFKLMVHSVSTLKNLFDFDQCYCLIYIILLSLPYN